MFDQYSLSSPKPPFPSSRVFVGFSPKGFTDGADAIAMSPTSILETTKPFSPFFADCSPRKPVLEPPQPVELGIVEDLKDPSCTESRIELSNMPFIMSKGMRDRWLLENKGNDTVVVPMMNVRRATMWKCKQAAWLFQHLGIDASSLLFANEVDIEGLIMARQLSIIVLGEDVLKTNGEAINILMLKVGSSCTVLTNNYCEVAYNLLQAPNLKKLMLAGILLDTQNLNSTTKFFTNRDAEAV